MRSWSSPRRRCSSRSTSSSSTTRAAATRRSAQPWEKPLVATQLWDRDLIAATRFEPGLPLTTEGLIYGLAGLILAALFGAGTRTVYGRTGGRRYAASSR